jgi:hypothetical protein
MNDAASGDRNGGSARLALAQVALGAAIAVSGRAGSLAAPEPVELDLDDPAQRRLGDHELLARIGSGGMGTVYRARQLSLDRMVAVKVLAASPWAPDDAGEAFRDEARRIARIRHPNVVPVFEFGRQDDLSYFSMPLVEGQALDRVLAGGRRFAARDAARLVAAVARGVDHAHRFGVLHLDLKPANILMDAGGVPMVADFGLSRLCGADAGEPDAAGGGTPGYMAPEQAAGDPALLGPATDVRALGAVLCELLCGQPPHADAPSVEALLARTREAEPAGPAAARPGVPADLDAICVKCLRLDPAQRYPSAAALADDLERWLSGHPVLARPPGALGRLARWAKRQPLVAALLALSLALLLSGLGTATWLWRAAEAGAAEARAAERLALQRLWKLRETRAEAALAEGDTAAALVEHADTLLDLEAAGDREGIARLRARIGALDAAGLRLIGAIDLAGGRERGIGALAIDAAASRIVVGLSDGEVIALDGATRAVQWRTDTAVLPRDHDDPTVQQLHFAADDRLLLVQPHFRSGNARPSGWSMHALDARDGRPLPLTTAVPGLLDLTYSRDARFAIARDRDGRARRWRVDPPAPDGDDFAVPPGAPTWLLAPGGESLAVASGVLRYLELRDARDGRVRWRAEQPRGRYVSSWAFSPDGRWLVFGDEGGAVQQLDTTTLALRTIHAHDGLVSSVLVSADGRWGASAASWGGMHAFMLPSGEPLAVPMRLGGGGALVQAIFPESRLLLGARLGSDVRLLRLPDPGDRPGQALPVARAAHGVQVDRHAAAYAPRSGLLATGGMDGELRLWSLPPPARASGHAPRLALDPGRVEDAATLAVEGARVVVADATGRTLATVVAEGPVNHAGVDATRAHLVFATGRSVTVHALPGGARRWSRALPSTPSRLASAPGHLVAAWPEADGDGTVLAVQAFAIGDGTPVGAPLRLAGVDWRLAGGAAGTRMVASTAGGALAWFDALGATAPQPLPAAGAWRRIVHVEVDPAAGRALVAGDRASGPAAVLLDLARGTAVAAVESPSPIGDAAISGDGGRAALLLDEGVLLFGAGIDGGRRLPASLHAVRIALDGDGRRVVLASRGEVALLRDDGEPLAGPLGWPMNQPNLPAEIALQDDRLQLRSFAGDAFAWTLAPATAPASILREAAAVASGATALRGHPREAELRAFLRSREPGPRPQDAPAALDHEPPLPRPASLPPGVLPLDAAYTAGLGILPRPHGNAISELRGMPRGLLRLRGVDFDVRGVVQLVADGDEDSAPPRTPPLPVGRRVQAVHLLLTHNDIDRPADAPGRTRAQLVFAYRDGGEARVPLRDQQEIAAVLPHRAGRGAAPLAMVVDCAYCGYRGLAGRVDSYSLYAPRLANPHPDRVVAQVALVAGPEPGSVPLLLAASVEDPAR